MPSSQRPFFLSSFLAAFRPQQAASSLSPASSQANKHHTSHSHSHSPQQQAGSSSSPSAAAAGTRSLSTSAAAAAAAAATTSASSSSPPPTSSTPPQSTPRSHSHQRGAATATATATLHSPRAAHGGIPIPAAGGRRRGSDSSSEGFRDVLGGEKWYIGGRTAGGEERFFKLGVVRRARSQDRLSLDRLSL